MENLGHSLSRQTVANILRRSGLDPAPERGLRTIWKDFIRSHLSVLAATDFFTVEMDVPRAHHLQRALLHAGGAAANSGGGNHKRTR